jgi:Dihydroorotate dehydrogenase
MVQVRRIKEVGSYSTQKSLCLKGLSGFLVIFVTDNKKIRRQTERNDVYEFLEKGATVVQLYSALLYQGIDLPKTICAEMLAVK